MKRQCLRPSAFTAYFSHAIPFSVKNKTQRVHFPWFSVSMVLLPTTVSTMKCRKMVIFLFFLLGSHNHICFPQKQIAKKNQKKKSQKNFDIEQTENHSPSKPISIFPKKNTAFHMIKDSLTLIRRLKNT